MEATGDGLLRLIRTILAGTALASGLVACLTESPRPSPTDPGDRAPILFAFPSGLPPPYDFAGVRTALSERGSILTVPTPDEVKNARVPADAFLANLRTTVEETYPGEGADVVSVYLAVVDRTDPRLTVTHRLTYVVETTGHATGNCFTLYDASGSGPYLAACFYVGRSRPGGE